MKKFRNLSILFVILFIWLALAGGIRFYLEGLWFASLGYWQVFETFVTSRFLTFLTGALIVGAILWSNFQLSLRPGATAGFWFKQEFIEVTLSGLRFGLKAVAAAVALIGGVALQTHWMTFLLFLNAVPAGETDPIFGRDIGFYFFELPVYTVVTDFLLLVLGVAFLLTALSYLLGGHLGYRDGFRLSTRARIHLTVLLGVTLAFLSIHFWLQRFSILYSQTGVVYGAGYTDVNAWLPCYWLLCILAALTSVVVLTTLVSRSWKPVALAFLGFAAGVGLLNLYPVLIQTFVVSPNELQKESPYILHNVDSTLQAYKLDEIEVHEFQPSSRLSTADLQANEGTLRNIRLWDWRPLRDAYSQLQSIRLYYEFEDVDVDRYIIDGEYRQIMLSARELDFSRITETAQNWINQHFQYTHGQGLCMSPVNEVTPDGLPEFFIKDIPPRSMVDLQVERPEIYFGEVTDYPVFVHTDMKEFDYPLGDTNATTTYEAERGLPIGSSIMRLLFAWDLGIYQILFTGNFNSESRVLLNRRIQDRVPRLAPFLEYDQDPYLVVADGRLYWMLDAYTSSSRYPYSEPFPSRESPRFNYMRNSVKVVVDAYLGDVDFYLADESDPLIQAFSDIFPDMFQSMSDMPESLRQHIRYPVDFFDVQRSVYRQYHMKDPTVFYNQEDAWEIPNEIYRGNEQTMASYYVIMALPGQSREEFILMIPYTPRNKNNMIAWLAARSDGEHYGKLVLYQFPKQELTYGPMQIEARIDQDPDISQLLTLWSQEGSQVIRGNLLVIPVAESVLYVEPLYLQAEKSEIPELTRVIVVFQSEVALGETLEEALRLALEESRDPRPETTEVESEEAPPEISGEEIPEDLLREAIRHYRASQAHLQAGDWTGYGEEQQRLGEVLEALRREIEGAPSQ